MLCFLGIHQARSIKQYNVLTYTASGHLNIGFGYSLVGMLIDQFDCCLEVNEKSNRADSSSIIHLAYFVALKD